MRIGELELHPISDGTFIARPGYFADDVAPDVHPEFFSPPACGLAADRLLPGPRW
jgi:hypothetical protein